MGFDAKVKDVNYKLKSWNIHIYVKCSNWLDIWYMENGFIYICSSFETIFDEYHWSYIYIYETFAGQLYRTIRWTQYTNKNIIQL